MKCRLDSCVGWSCSITLSLLAACSSLPPAAKRSAAEGDVKAQKLTSPDSERYEHSTNVEYIQALAYPENGTPVYPAQLLARRLPPMTVRVQLVVGANGMVVGVESLDATTTSERDGLFEAVHEACLL